jgi:hypothetical protein
MKILRDDSKMKGTVKKSSKFAHGSNTAVKIVGKKAV